MRALEGALIRVVAFASLTGRPITAELAAEVLTGLYPAAKPARPSVRAIQEQHRRSLRRSPSRSCCPRSRAAAVAWPRQVAMYLARELTEQTLPAIGRAFGGRNHTTVLHAYRRTAERMAADPEAYEAVRRLADALRGRSAQRDVRARLTDSMARVHSPSIRPSPAPSGRFRRHAHPEHPL